MSHFVAQNTIKLAYQEYFNMNDVFNHYLYKRYFPYSTRSGWESNYTDFMFAAYQMNLFTMYHELIDTAGKELDRVWFTKRLIELLMDLVTIREDRPDGRFAKFS
jgi:hypothetical protein